MPVKRIFTDTEGRKLQAIQEFSYSLPDGSKTFTITYVFEPHARSPSANKDKVHEIIGDNKCLGITESDVTNYITGSSFNLVARARDDARNDEAICTAQYVNWCMDVGYPEQLWINDLCRISTLPKGERTEPSPVSVLLAHVESLIASQGIPYTWMLIDKKKTETHDPDKLIEIYSRRYDYVLVGEGTGVPPCSMSKNMRAEYHVMRKSLILPATAANMGPVGGAGSSATTAT